MRVDQTHLATVAFLCVARSAGAITQPDPKSTIFFVVAPIPGQPSSGALWAVTGRHCIQEARATGKKVSVRVNSPEGMRDVPTHPDDWHESTEADVACCLWNPVDNRPVESAIPIEQLVDETYTYRFGKLAEESVRPMTDEPIYVGAETVFVGLFSEAAGKERNLPIARFGNVSRLPSEEIALQRADHIEHIEGYLVEARSWGGHSGSPVFWTHPVTRVQHVPISGNRAERRRGAPSTMPVSHPDHMFALLGLVSAHYDIAREGKAKGDDKTTIVTRLNSGMAVVTPAHFIRRLIESEPVVEQVVQAAEQVAGEFEPAATMDFIRDDTDTDDEFERFEDLTRKLVQTPKPPSGKKSSG